MSSNSPQIESITIGFSDSEQTAAWLLEHVTIQYKETIYRFVVPISSGHSLYSSLTVSNLTAGCQIVWIRIPAGSRSNQRTATMVIVSFLRPFPSKLDKSDSFFSPSAFQLLKHC